MHVFRSWNMIRINNSKKKMYSITPKSTEILEDFTKSPIFERVIDQDLKQEQFFQSQDFNRMPVTHKLRVSQKLLENRLRRIEINMQKKQQVESMIERKRAKEREIESSIRTRLEYANRKKEENLRHNHSQQENRKKGEDFQSKQKLNRFQANLQKIEKGRCKAEQKKTEYIFRIHRRTEQNMRRVQERRKLIQSIEEAENDQVHLEQWNSYKEKLMRKYEGRQKSPPDHLYQDFKQRNQKLKHIISSTIELPKEHKEHKQMKNQENSQDNPFNSSASAKSLMIRSQRAEYFGIHEQNMMSKTTKEIEKMRRFLENQGNYQNFVQNEQVYNNFKRFFCTEILHK